MVVVIIVQIRNLMMISFEFDLVLCTVLDLVEVAILY